MSKLTWGNPAAARDLAAAHRLAVRDGLNEGTWNHMSLVLVDAPELMLITPGFTHWSEVRVSTLAVVGADGHAVRRGGPVPSRAGWVVHGPIHDLLPHARCLMHVHTPHITALSMRAENRLDTCASQLAAGFHDDVAYLDAFDGVLDDEDQGRRMADTLGERRVLMLRNHGAMVAAPDVARAYLDLYQLERACMYQVLATCNGCTTIRFPEAVARRAAAFERAGEDAPRHFSAMRAVLDRLEPDYAH